MLDMVLGLLCISVAVIKENCSYTVILSLCLTHRPGLQRRPEDKDELH